MSNGISGFLINYNDITRLKSILNERDLEEFYRYLSDKGDMYSLTAPGSNNEHSFLSRLCFRYDLDVYSYELDYMDLRYELYKVQYDLAKEYMFFLERELKNNNGEEVIINIFSEELYNHYVNVFKRSDMFIRYWDTNIAMLFFSSEGREVFWESKLSYSDSFKGQVMHYFKTINYLLDSYESYTDKKNSFIAKYLENNYNLFMYERGRELIEEQKDIILKDKEICDLIYTVHMKYAKYKDEINIKIGNVYDLIDFQENKVLHSDKISLKNEIMLKNSEVDVENRRKKGQLIIILMSLLQRKMMLLEYMRSLKK
ncbi:hypothetical protein [Providencia sp. Me31A]|uniref:hypothetical protein n=1 Tax=Providencia sp. Me31A TaxID=3392637 RepID=UPI003D294BB7